MYSLWGDKKPLPKYHNCYKLHGNTPAKPMAVSTVMLKSCGFFIADRQGHGA